MLPAIPTPIPMPFAQNGERRAIPETNTTPGSADASWATGFPPVTRINKQAGGKPPYGLDFQGLFHTICEHLFFSQSGNTVPWVGASDGQPGLNYLKGAIVQASDGEIYMALKPSGPDVADSAGTGMVGPVDPAGDESGHWMPLSLMFAGMPNDEEWITASGTWTAKVTGWHEITIWHGGCGGWWSVGLNRGRGGFGREPRTYLAYYEAGEEVPVSIGAGGLGSVNDGAYPMQALGGTTTFGNVVGESDAAASYIYTPYLHAGLTSSNATYISGAGQGAGNADEAIAKPAHFYGAGGAVCYTTGGTPSVTDGFQGAALVRFHNSAKAGGALPAPTLFMARRMAARVAAEPATVNLYDPETGLGSVWREEDMEAKLAEGWLTQSAWVETCAERAAEEYAQWLADPGTETERFRMLRAAREAKLASYDAAVAELRRKERAGEDVADILAAWDTYANALCSLPQQEGAPWDGGGAATPWPATPVLTDDDDDA